MPAIEATGLTKHFFSVKKDPGLAGSFRGLFSREKIVHEAVKDVSFSVEAGEIIGFLGPNGAGKTTTIKMLTGILHPTSGEARVLGFKPFDRKPDLLRNISLVMGNKMQLWWDLPAIESFKVMRALYDIDSNAFSKRLEFLSNHLQIADKLNTQVRKLSLGERMKCELIAALLHRPQVVFLDEPTIGLDVISQKRIREFLKLLNQEDGCTILLTSHYMQDVQELCKRVVMIQSGVISYDGSLGQLAQDIGGAKRLRITFATDVPSLGHLGTIVEEFEGGVTLTVPRERATGVASELLREYDIADIAIEDPPIEDVIEQFTLQQQSR